MAIIDPNETSKQAKNRGNHSGTREIEEFCAFRVYHAKLNQLSCRTFFLSGEVSGELDLQLIQRKHPPLVSIQIRTMIFCPLFPCVLRFAYISWLKRLIVPLCKTSTDIYVDK